MASLIHWQRHGSTPYRVSCFQNPFELAPLIGFGNGDVIEAAKPALWTERELFHGEMLGRLVDAPSQQIERLQIGTLGRHQAKNCDLVRRHEAQRRKAPRAL